jgi:hypothetical protein
MLSAMTPHVRIAPWKATIIADVFGLRHPNPGLEQFMRSLERMTFGCCKLVPGEKKLNGIALNMGSWHSKLGC